MTDKAHILELLNKHDLGEVAERIAGLARPCLRIETMPAEMEELAIGQSRIGGIPDLPEGAEWPRSNSRPLWFLAQINLAETAGFAAAAELPKQGHLLFFYDVEEKPWGFSPAHAGGWKVIHHEGDDLVRQDYPEPVEDGLFSACRVSFKEELTMPPKESSALLSLELEEEQRNMYGDFLGALPSAESDEDDWPEASRLLGYPDQIQCDMQLQCALVTNGLYCGNSSGYKDPRAKELAKDAASWRLLLQLNTESDCGMMWGDCGCLYFWIHDSDLKASDLERVWVVLQCF